MNTDPVSHPGAARANPRTKWQPARRVLRRRLLAQLLAIDVLATMASFELADVAYGGGSGGVRPLLMSAVMLFIYLVTALHLRAYAAEVLSDTWRAVGRSLHALCITLGVVILVVFWLKASGQVSRLTLTLGAAGCAVAMAGARLAFVRRAKRLLGGNPFDVVLICDRDQPLVGRQHATVLAADDFFDPDRHDPEMYDRLATALQAVDRVVVACSVERRASWAHALKGASLQGEIIAPELTALAPLGFDSHGGRPTVIVANGPLQFGDRIVKRVFDLVMAGACLLLLSPLLVLVAVLVRLDSPGPIFFTQKRIGQGNAQFRLIKFRSMRQEASDGDGHRSTSRDDDRITRLGAFIRRTSIDELPQLLNVLAGDMSIVGPRPHAVGSRAAEKLFWEIDSRYWHRHAAKPGLTGLAQVRGYRGATIHESDLTNRLQADLEYLTGWSLWKDLQIIARTFTVVLHRNAF